MLLQGPGRMDPLVEGVKLGRWKAVGEIGMTPEVWPLEPLQSLVPPQRIGDFDPSSQTPQNLEGAARDGKEFVRLEVLHVQTHPRGQGEMGQSKWGTLEGAHVTHRSPGLLRRTRKRAEMAERIMVERDR